MHSVHFNIQYSWISPLPCLYYILIPLAFDNCSYFVHRFGNRYLARYRFRIWGIRNGYYVEKTKELSGKACKLATFALSLCLGRLDSDFRLFCHLLCRVKWLWLYFWRIVLFIGKIWNYSKWVRCIWYFCSKFGKFKLKITMWYCLRLIKIIIRY